MFRFTHRYIVEGNKYLPLKPGEYIFKEDVYNLENSPAQGQTCTEFIKEQIIDKKEFPISEKQYAVSVPPN